MNEIVNFPPLTFEQFMAIPNGTRVFNYGGDQCVALANLYHVSVLGGSLAGTRINSAYQWWTDFEKYPQFTNLYTKVLDNPQRGDIFVAKPSRQYDPVHGHIGIVERSWNGSNFGTMEQNAGSGAKRWVWRYERNMSNIYGFLRPKTSPQPTPPIPSNKKKEENKMMLCHKFEPDGSIVYLLFCENFYLDFVGQEAAVAFAYQVGSHSAPVSQSFFDKVKREVEAGRK
jgi:hypothetical protein